MWSPKFNSFMSGTTWIAPSIGIVATVAAHLLPPFSLLASDVGPSLGRMRMRASASQSEFTKFDHAVGVMFRTYHRFVVAACSAYLINAYVGAMSRGIERAVSTSDTHRPMPVSDHVAWVLPIAYLMSIAHVQSFSISWSAAVTSACGVCTSVVAMLIAPVDMFGGRSVAVVVCGTAVLAISTYMTWLMTHISGSVSHNRDRTQARCIASMTAFIVAATAVGTVRDVVYAARDTSAEPWDYADTNTARLMYGLSILLSLILQSSIAFAWGSQIFSGVVVRIFAPTTHDAPDAHPDCAADAAVYELGVVWDCEPAATLISSGRNGTDLDLQLDDVLRLDDEDSAAAADFAIGVTAATDGTSPDDDDVAT
jgi:hypothetical protein